MRSPSSNRVSNDAKFSGKQKAEAPSGIDKITGVQCFSIAKLKLRTPFQIAKCLDNVKLDGNVIASVSQRSNPLKPRDCFGKKRLAMT
jgi:hypothetical protein